MKASNGSSDESESPHSDFLLDGLSGAGMYSSCECCCSSSSSKYLRHGQKARVNIQAGKTTSARTGSSCRCRRMRTGTTLTPLRSWPVSSARPTRCWWPNDWSRSEWNSPVCWGRCWPQTPITAAAAAGWPQIATTTTGRPSWTRTISCRSFGCCCDAAWRHTIVVYRCTITRGQTRTGRWG